MNSELYRDKTLCEVCRISPLLFVNFLFIADFEKHLPSFPKSWQKTPKENECNRRICATTLGVLSRIRQIKEICQFFYYYLKRINKLFAWDRYSGKKLAEIFLKNGKIWDRSGVQPHGGGVLSPKMNAPKFSQNFE